MKRESGQLFKAALFDFDGVIVHSTPIHLDGWAHAYRALFQREIDVDLLQTLVGQSTVEIGTLLAKQSGKPEARSELTRHKAKYVLENLASIPLIPGVGEFIIRLTAARIPYGIASNAPRAFLESALTRHQLPHAFYLGLEDYAHPKPHPEPYLKGAKKLSWDEHSHHEIAVFEDSVHGVQSALKAEMIAIGVCSQHTPDILKKAGAFYCIEDFLDYKLLETHFAL
ncbi:MAG: HAD family phosphatase [Chitinophagaceae bacterium]|nr:HAD family phosphatase [Oligoflexus sp.]